MLKSCKGITLTSLVIYVIVLMVVIALMSGFSGYFNKNINQITLYKKDSIYYINEAKNKKIRICNNVNSCDFEYDNTNKILTVNIVINNEEYSKSLNVNIN